MKIILILFISIFMIDMSYAKTNKEPIVGLIAMGSPIAALRHKNPLREVKAHPDVYSGVVIDIIWKYVEPRKGEYNFSLIDNALKDIEIYNKKHKTNPISAKLRIFGGPVAPFYVKKINGGPILIKKRGYPLVKIGLFWTKEYGDRFAELLKHLSNKYDRHPLVKEVCVSTAASLTAEPFIAPLDRKNNPKLRALGFTDKKYQKAIERALIDYNVWKYTVVDFPFNVFTSTDNKPKSDVIFTTNLMKRFRELYGNRSVISNHGLQKPLSRNAKLIYPTIKELGAPLAFQTIGPNVDFDKAVKLGFKYGMTEFEVWDTVKSGGRAKISYEQLKKWAKMFKK